MPFVDPGKKKFGGPKSTGECTHWPATIILGHRVVFFCFSRPCVLSVLSDQSWAVPPDCFAALSASNMVSTLTSVLAFAQPSLCCFYSSFCFLPAASQCPCLILPLRKKVLSAEKYGVHHDVQRDFSRLRFCYRKSRLQ